MRSNRLRASRGQNLVEFAMTFPLLLVLVFMTVEFGRVWQAFQGAKLAAVDGAHTAAVNHNPGVGTTQITRRLASANLQGSGSVAPIGAGTGYQANVTVAFTPMFAGLSIPIIGGPNLTIIPNSFPITYSTESTFAVY